VEVFISFIDPFLILNRSVPGVKLLKLSELELLPPVTGQDKVLCVGMNYKDHCAEQNAPIPTMPVLFSKFASTLIGSGAPILFNPQLTQVQRHHSF
jgi:2-keto-4-pentenoate hydratase/2-oxohepta-3-ene-1,7-dioic acid hydratase in catechol pathway